MNSNKIALPAAIAATAVLVTIVVARKSRPIKKFQPRTLTPQHVNFPSNIRELIRSGMSVADVVAQFVPTPK